MKSLYKYIVTIIKAIHSLVLGMIVTFKEFFVKKITEQYPENRHTTLHIAERFRAYLVMPHDENNEHACTACGICQMNCPNQTIQVVSKMVEAEDGGKPKRVLDKYYYDLGQCTFCNLCVVNCPSHAIKFVNDFENSVFTRDKLKMTLNHEGSKKREQLK
ncbi:MAG: 4Fe-4S dicluster domain-containing protein [Bacteroidota bacterium]|nr:4Fe-4S dicluster domain-containing protein [Bacteroidota bacterium]